MNLKTYYIHTFGCAMNEYDTERIAAALERRSLIQAESAESADVIILNTCSVREKPQIKISSYLGRIRERKEKKSGMLVGITGCVAQQDGEALLNKFKVVDFVAGTETLGRIDAILDKAFSGERFADTGTENGEFSIDGFERKKSVKAYVTVMKGCENFCSYCIVPFVRGKEASRSSAEIIDDIKRLVDSGVKEVCLLGQNVNSYGKNLTEKTDFPDLLYKVNKIDGLKRLRFMTSHPKDFSEKMINAVAECEKIWKFIHLPLQSGSDSVLKNMNRGYTFKEYADKIDLTKKIIPEVRFSSDFIVGFPGETQDDFERTLFAIDYVGYEHVFAFNYSPRPMTSAGEMADNVPADVKSARLARLFEVQDKVHENKREKLNGTVIELIVTGERNKAEGIYCGSNVCDKTISFKSKRSVERGEIVKIRLEKEKDSFLFGYEV